MEHKFISMIGTGHLLGDCLGIQYETKINRKRQFFLNIMYNPRTFNRFQKEKSAVLGQWSDDTEMALCILNVLQENDYYYDKNKIIKKYIEWTNSKPLGIGKNTKKLFQGIKTMDSYYKRVQNNALQNIPISQSNGTLMRAFPLLFAKNCDEAIIEDVKLTNNNEINIECSKIYISILRSLYNKTPLEFNSDIEIITNIIKYAKSDADSRMIQMKFDLKKSGWVVYSLYFAIYAALVKLSYLDIYEQILELKIDPDTNGAISGAVIAMRFQESFMNNNLVCYWKNIIFNCNTSQGDYPRPEQYNPKNYY